MATEDRKVPEPPLYESDESDVRYGLVQNLEDFVEIPSRWRAINLWTEKMGAETIGCQQLPEEARDPKQKPHSTFFVWCTANFHYAGLTTGALGPLLFGLGWWDSFLTVLFFGMIGTVGPAIISSLGPRLGMRGMIITRYSFGFWTSKVIVLLNAVTCIGWLIINTVAGGGLMYDAFNGKLPLVACIVILLLLSVIASFLGYKAIHFYDRYGWALLVVILTICCGFGGKQFVNVPMAKGQDAKLGVLSYGALIFAWDITWFPLAADYSLYMPSKTSKWSTFAWTFIGLYAGSTFVFLIGVAFATLVANPNPAYGFANVYNSRGIGGLIGAVFNGYAPGVRGFGRFIQVVLALSIIAANIPNIYSFGLSIQAISSFTQKIPRALVTLFGSAVALIVSCIVRNHFVETLENFINVLSYWCTPFSAVVLTEHFVFRRSIGYDVSVWDTPPFLPAGIAAIFAWACGIAIALCGADQTWLVGPIAKAIGGDGADVGWEFAAATSSIIYVPARMVELMFMKR